MLRMRLAAVIPGASAAVGERRRTPEKARASSDGIARGSAVNTEHPPLVALIAAHDSGDGSDSLRADPTVALGAALSRWGGADVFVCPWEGVHLTRDAIRLVGPVLRFVGGEWGTCTADNVRPDALLAFPTADHTAANRSPGGRAALTRLALGGLEVSSCNPATADVIAALLEEAGRCGIVTNAVGHDTAWGRKDHLEFILRAHARFTGTPVPRPETYVVLPHQLPAILADFARRDRTCIIKPANGARGDGLRIVRPHTSDTGNAVPTIHDDTTATDDCLVVQELVEAPLTLGGHKIDFRCYVLIDTADASASHWCAPLFARIAGLPYARGVADAEITNCAYRARAGLAEGMFPLEHLDGLPAATHAALLAGVDAVVSAVIAARFLRARAFAPAGEPRRVLLWGLDLIATETHSGLAVRLLEVNVHPHLIIDSPTCDPAVERILGQIYAPLLRPQCTEGAA